MGKKRKASNLDANASKGPNMDVGESRKRIRNYEDVADSGDEFEMSRNKILLEEDPSAKRRRKLREEEEFLEDEDEEVLDYSEDEEDKGEDEADEGYDGADSDGSEDDGRDIEEDDEEGVSWGMAKGEIYGADAIETEEQALEEEAEALRLQKKQLQSMTEADYGFDEDQWQQNDGPKGIEGDRNTVTEVLPQLQISQDLGPAERLKILKARYPEFEHLSKELLFVKDQHAALAEQIKGGRQALPNARTKLRAASAYAVVLSMYFALLSSPAAAAGDGAVAMPATLLRNHPVMDSLVRCRNVWNRAKNLPKDVDIATDDDESRALTNGNNHEVEEVDHMAALTKMPKKSRAQRHAEAAQAAAQKRQAERLQRTEADLANLDSLITRKGSKKSRVKQNDDSDAGEELPLTAHEAAEKARQKKSLRFYTSQIAQKASKRGTAGRNAGGDEDIPYRERLKDRQARLNAEAERRGKKAAAAGDELGGASDDEDVRQAREIRNDGDDYYDVIASRAAKKKSEKIAFAEAQRQAAQQGGRVIEEETVGPDGKRKITYAIEKNKGLTPHRKKESRNPRVKKRMKFDEKKKKLGSVRAVYKGGEGKGGYGGELTGIKKGLVKSVKL